MPRLAGKIAWITGAGSGIGEAAALALAEEGATVVLTGRTRDKLDGVAARIHQKGGTAHVQPADLMDPKQVQARRRIHQGHARPAGHPGEQRRAQHPRPALGQTDAGGHRPTGATAT